MNAEVISMPDSNQPAEAGPGVAPGARYLRFGSFYVDQHRHELYHDGRRLKVQGKVYQVLSILLENSGEVVTREALRKRLWPAESQVNYDANVNTTVNKLRQLLGDSPEQSTYIETIPRLGYSFIAQAEPMYAMPSQEAAPANGTAQHAHAASANAQDASAAVGAGVPERWVVLGVVGLIVAGMLLGAGIATLWIAHFAPITLRW
jgi:DNA-binding winged helix-turn-helix (wHTH) protein